jgi:hypothetical protein
MTRFEQTSRAIYNDIINEYVELFKKLKIYLENV